MVKVPNGNNPKLTIQCSKAEMSMIPVTPVETKVSVTLQIYLFKDIACDESSPFVSFQVVNWLCINAGQFTN